jgi:clan AA aspartic protease (TIGR02281 family)
MTNRLRAFCIVLLSIILCSPVNAESIQLEFKDGTYMLPVRINGQMILPFVLDTGASEVAIPEDVFSTLRRTGTIKETDFVGSGVYTMADGSTQESERFILHQLQVGSRVVEDVIANVVPLAGSPLLGQSFLSKLPAWAIDNERHTLVFRDEQAKPQSENNLSNQSGGPELCAKVGDRLTG